MSRRHLAESPGRRHPHCTRPKTARLPQKFGIERDRPFERRFRRSRDNPVGGEHQRFPQSSFALGGNAVEPQCIAPRLDRLIEATESQIDWRDDFPAAPVLRMALKMVLHLRNQPIDRGTAVGSGKARRKRLIRQ